MFKKIHFPTIDSTHKWALRNLEANICITADFQTDGVGRKGDPWHASPGKNILCTLVFPAPPHDSQNLAQLLAYSTMKTLEDLPILFKWPNDLHLHSKKLAGILCDIKNAYAILSMGLNMHEAPLPTSICLGRPYDLDRLLQTFTEDLSIFQKKGFSPFFQEFSNRLAYLGRQATSGGLTGTIKNLNRDGRLVLEKDGKEVLVSSGSLQIITIPA